MKKNLRTLMALVLCLAMAMTMATAALAQTADGIYEGAGQGLNGPIKVSVTVAGGAITEVKVLEHAETPGISDPAIAQIPAAIVAANGTEVDSVTGATFTSQGIKDAVNAALNGDAAEEEAGEFALERDPDVIVIGAGMSGMVAAVRSAQLGANVLLLEQSGRVGGSANFAGGSISGAGYEVQKKAGIEDTADLFYGDFVRLGGEENINKEIARTHAERSGAAIDWLYNEVGVSFGDERVDTGVYEPMYPNRVTYADGLVNPPGGVGYVRPLEAKVNEYIQAGLIQLELNALVTDITLEDGAVTGVMIGEREIKAPSTIIATGGYGHSEEWLKKYNFTNITTNDPATAIGSGYNFAAKAGAVFDNMDYVSVYGGAVPVDGFEHTTSFGITVHRAYVYPGLVFTDEDGNRLTDEMAYSALNYDLTWSNAKNNIVYIFMAENMIDENNIIMSGPLGVEFEGNGWPTFYELVEGGEYIIKADTIAELAQKLGMKDLEATFETYNADCAAGVDSKFGRTASLIPFDKGPFYAVRTLPYCMMTAGGPRINAQSQMVREDGSVIPGAYVCGEIIGSANIGGHATIGGIGHGMNATWGLIAAENAVANAGK